MANPKIQRNKLICVVKRKRVPKIVHSFPLFAATGEVNAHIKATWEEMKDSSGVLIVEVYEADSTATPVGATTINAAINMSLRTEMKMDQNMGVDDFESLFHPVLNALQRIARSMAT